MLIQFLAFVAMALTLLSVLLTPAAFGRSRGEYDYTFWFSQIIEGALVWALALRVLGVI